MKFPIANKSKVIEKSTTPIQHLYEFNEFSNEILTIAEKVKKLKNKNCKINSFSEFTEKHSHVLEKITAKIYISL